MLNRLVRRISTSLFQRPDRPWNDDPTSTAPSVGSKRRFTDDDGDDGDDQRAMPPPTSPISPGFDSESLTSSRVKRQRVLDVQDETRGVDKVEEEGVKEVTEGVREVEITSQSSGDKSVVEDCKEDSVKQQRADEATRPEEEEEASNVPLPDSPLLLPLSEQSLTPTSQVDPLATEPVECRGFEGGEAVADEEAGEEVATTADDKVDDVVHNSIPDTVDTPTVAAAPDNSASATDDLSLTATTLPLETATTTTTSVAPPSELSS